MKECDYLRRWVIKLRPAYYLRRSQPLHIHLEIFQVFRVLTTSLHSMQRLIVAFHLVMILEH